MSGGGRARGVEKLRRRERKVFGKTGSREVERGEIVRSSDRGGLMKFVVPSLPSSFAEAKHSSSNLRSLLHAFIGEPRIGPLHATSSKFPRFRNLGQPNCRFARPPLKSPLLDPLER